jgi:hypothetical protein
MAAILKLRRGTSASPSLVDGELFLNYTTGTIQFASGSTPVVSNLLPLNKSINGTIILDGNISASNLYLTGDVIARDFNGRDIRLSGNIFLGDEIADNISITAQFSGSLIPSASAEYDLGSDVKKWNNLYVVSASIDNVSFAASNIVSSSQQISDYNVFLEIGGDSVVSGSSQINLTQTTNYISGIKTRLNAENVISGSSQVQINDVTGFTTFSSSVDGRLDSLESDGNVVDARLTNLELFSSSQELKDSTLETVTSSFDNRLDNLESFTSSYFVDSASVDSRLDYIEGTFSQSVDTRITSLESFSSSLDDTFVTTDELHTATSSLSASLTDTDNDFENRINILETTFSSSVDLRLDNSELTGSDHETRITLIEGYSASLDIRLDNLEWTGSNQESRLDVIETTFSSSVDSRLDLLENFSSSEYIVDSSSFDQRVDYLEASQSYFDDTFSGSVDSRLDELEGPFSSSVHQQLSSIHSYTSSLKTAINTSGTDLIVYGNLTVQGTQTSLNTSQTYIEDLAITLASGALDGAEANGAGIEIAGANQSLTWDNPNLQWAFTGQVSASSFIGDGSELINIPLAGIIFDGSGIVSGSSQINLTQTTNYISGIKTRLNVEGVISGSSQVNADSITNFDTNVKDKLNDELVHSGSYLGTATTSNLDEGSHLYYTNERVKTKLDLEGVFSSSAQVNADTITNFDSNVLAYNNSLGIISGSSQVNADTITNFDSNVLDKINAEGVLSGSGQLTESLDTRYLQISGDGVISGSSQVDLTQTTNYESGIVDILNTRTLVSGSSQVTESLDERYLQISGDGVFTSSIQVNFTEISNKPTLISGSSQVILSDTDGYSGFSTSLDSRLDSLELDQHTHTNKSNLDSINQDLSTTDKPTFENINLPNLTLLPSASEFSILLYSQSGEIAYSELGTAAYYHVSQSISNGDSDVIGTAAAIKEYIDEQLLIIGAGDITAVIAGDGLGGGADSGPATLTLDTGSQYFIDGVNGVVQLGDGIVSSSSQISNYGIFAELNGDNLVSSSTQISSYGIFAELNGDGLVSGSSQIEINSVDGFTSYSSSVDGRLDSLEGETHENPLTFTDTSTIDFTRFNNIITANVIGGIVSSSAQISGYNTFLEINGDDVVSGSSQIDLTQTQNYTSFSTSLDERLDNIEGFTSSIDTTIKAKLNAETVISGSSQVNADTITNFDSNVLSYIDSLGVVSGSSQILAGSGIFSSSVQVNADSITNFDTNVKDKLNVELVVSSSSQISAYNVFAELNGDNLVSSSAQVKSLLPAGTVSGSSQVNADTITNFDTNVKDKLNADGVISGSDQITGSLVDLISDQTISGTKTFNDIVVNGTGSFAYITSVDGEAKIIGDAYIILNNDTPTQRYAGIAVYDSGSATPTTASFNFDGQTNDWFYEYSASTVDYGVVLFGPEYNTKGNPTYLTANTIPKAEGTHHLNDSNITDDGSLITLGSNVQVNGNISITGTVDSVDVALLKSEFDTLKGKTLVSGSSQVNHDSTTGFVPNEHIDHSTVSITAGNGLTGGGTIAATRTLNVVSANNGIVVNADNIELSTSSTTFTGGVKSKLNLDGVISGSSQTTLVGDVTGAANANTVGKIQGIAITSGEATQLANINTTTISATQWGYLGGLDQGLTTTSTVQFGKVGIGGASDATYELKVTGDIGATGDVVAYISSDRRLKDEITPIQNSLQKINSIGGYSFVWNENQHIYKGKDYGVIAQEIEEILPELVETRENGYKAVKYDRIVSLLIEGIKELSKEVSELKEKIGK